MKQQSFVSVVRRHLCGVLLLMFVLSAFSPAAFAAATARAGDIDGDRKITAADARTALRIAVELSVAADEIFPYADVDGDGKIKAEDARRILRAAVGLEDAGAFAAFPAQTPFKGKDIPYWSKREMSDFSLSAGTSYTIKKEFVKRRGTQYYWTSSNPDVATVSAAGRIVAKAKGFSCIYLTVGANRYYYFVHVITPLQKKIFALKNKYPDGYYWNAHKKSKKYPAVSEIPCSDHESGRYEYCIGQCAGFASLLSDEVFGEDAPKYVFTDKKKIKIGDYLRCLPGHSVFVIDRVEKGEVIGYDTWDDENVKAWDTVLTVAECNWDWHCGISWGREIALSDIRLDPDNPWFDSYSRYKG